jgi:outer membrane lipoprotein-sorting protein
VRIELQAEQGDTQVLYDGHTLEVYDAASNTLYRYTPPTPNVVASPDSLGVAEPEIQRAGASEISVSLPRQHHEVPTVAKIEEAISHLGQHATVSGATPTDIAGQPAYTVRISPKEGGSLIGGAELSWDAVHGVPLRAAIFSSTSTSPVIELASTSISYGPVADSVFNFTPPAGAKIDEIATHAPAAGSSAQDGAHPHPKITVHGHGISGIAVVEAKAKAGSEPSSAPEGLPKVNINGTSATELATELGTLLRFERSGVRYVLVGSVAPAAVEAVARGL